MRAMTQKTRQLCPFYYWTNSFIDSTSPFQSCFLLIPPVTSGPGSPQHTVKLSELISENKTEPVIVGLCIIVNLS